LSSDGRSRLRGDATLNRKVNLWFLGFVSPESLLASIQFSKSHPIFGGPDQNTEVGRPLSRLFWPFSRELRSGWFRR
jgi:hypothetical protein